MSKTWKVGIVKDSADYILGLHGLHTAFRGIPNVEVMGHVDSVTDDLEVKMAQTQAKRHYTTLDEMLESESLDIVILCSRHPADHLEQVRTVAAKGCHIYCEKPLAPTLREADEIVEIAEKHGTKICVAHSARYSTGFLAMKKMVEDGEIGTPHTVYGRGKCDHRGGGEDMMVLGTHVLDLEAFFFGAPLDVFAHVEQDGRPIVRTDRMDTVEPLGPTAGDTIFATYRFENGVRGIFESRRGLGEPNSDISYMGIAVTGTKGTITMRFELTMHPELSLHYDNGWRRRLRISRHSGPPEDDSRFELVPLTDERVIPDAEPFDLSLCGTRDVPKQPYFLETNRFAVWDLMQAIEEDRQPVSSVTDGRIALEMIHGVYASHLAGGVVPFPLESRAHPLGN